MNVEEIVRLILSQNCKLIRDDVIAAIERKRVASGGFLTDEAAARLVAAEFGVEMKLEKPLSRIHLGQLVSGLNDVTVLGRVLLVNMPRSFARRNKDGKISQLLIGDETGTIRVVLWDDKAKLTENVQLGQTVKVSHGYVRRSRNGANELHVGERGDVQIIIASPEMEGEELPPIRAFCEKIANISEMHKRTNVEGVIKRMYPISVFQRHDGTEGEVLRMVLEDRTGRVPVVFWNDKAEEVAERREGMKVLLMNVKVRKNRRDGILELHVDHFANVNLNLES
ncbi:MAG: OB-fold nucleic acid binding domain-containing protein [Candidatus Bathyarchaeia archaeon]